MRRVVNGVAVTLLVSAGAPFVTALAIVALLLIGKVPSHFPNLLVPVGYVVEGVPALASALIVSILSLWITNKNKLTNAAYILGFATAALFALATAQPRAGASGHSLGGAFGLGAVGMFSVVPFFALSLRYNLLPLGPLNRGVRQ